LRFSECSALLSWTSSVVLLTSHSAPNALRMLNVWLRFGRSLSRKSCLCPVNFVRLHMRKWYWACFLQMAVCLRSLYSWAPYWVTTHKSWTVKHYHSSLRIVDQSGFVESKFYIYIHAPTPLILWWKGCEWNF